MKKKIFVALIAIVVVTAIVGSAFALYSKDAIQRVVTFSTGDSVTLSLDSTSSFALTELAPNHDVTLNISLNASNVAYVESFVKGKLTVTVAAASAADADVALASAIDVNASGTDYSANKSQLATGVESDIIASRAITLTFSIAENDFLGVDGAAEGSVIISISYIHVDHWEPNKNDYYVVGTMTNWDMTKGSVILSDDPDDLAGTTYTAVIASTPLKAGDELKVRKWWNDEGPEGGFHWYSVDGGGNAVITEDGNYKIYIEGNILYVVKLD